MELSRAQARAVDEAAMHELAIPGLVLMEWAVLGIVGRLREARQEGRLATGPVMCLAGPGNNGGDALGVARHLALAGDSVAYACVGAARQDSHATVQRHMLEALDLPTATPADAERFALVVDGLFGTGLERPVAGVFAEAIEAVSASEVPCVAVDIPSGLDADTGEIWGHGLRACLTVTMVAPKRGFTHAREWTGAVETVGIGLPEGFARAVAARHPYQA